ncbi:MAG: hypothetical protein Q4G67_06475 [Actinomycetia bacterium]|nr:hypothetical protein [Actinomycetes bacterium]
MTRFTKALPFLAAVAAGYLIPAAVHPLLSEPTNGKALIFGSLLFINPLVAGGAAALFTWRHGTHWWFPVAAAALFVPISLIPPLNSSAVVYALLYAATAGAGVVVGRLVAQRPGGASGQPTPSTVPS